MSSPRSRRNRLIGAALLSLPVLELALIIGVGRAVGVLWTLLFLLAGAVVGVAVLRRAGAAAGRRLRAQSEQYRAASQAASRAASQAEEAEVLIPTPPAEPPVGTALLVPAGLLLLVPGFLSDAAGLLLLVPAVRRGVAARLGEAVTRRLNLRTVRAVRVVQGEVVDVRVTDVHVTEPGVDDPSRRRALPPPSAP